MTVFALAAIAAAYIVYKTSDPSLKPEAITQTQRDTAQVNTFLRQGDYYFNKPNRTNSDLDSSFIAITNAYRISRKIDYRKGTGLSMNTYSKLHNAKGDTLQGRKYADSAIAVLKSNNLTHELAYAYFNRSGFYPLEGDLLKRRIEWLKLAVDAFVQSGSKLEQAGIFKELGDLQQVDMNYTDALKSLQQSLSLYDSSDHGRLLGVYDLLGHVHSIFGNHRLALKYGLLGLKISEEFNDSTSAVMATLHSRIGLTYDRMEKYPNALWHFDKAERIALRNGDSSNWIIIVCNKANALRYMKKPREALQCISKIPERSLNDSRNIGNRGNIHALSMIINLSLKEYNTCRPYEKRLLADYAYEKQVGIHNFAVPSVLARYYLETHDLKKADRYWSESDEICKTYKFKANLLKGYRLRLKIDSAKGDFKEYIQHSRELQIMNDMMLSEQNNREIAQLQIEYETEKKDKDILLKEERIKLLDAENRIQHAELNQATLTRNVTIGSIILLIVIIAMLYNRYRFKNKINQAISQKNASLNQLVTEKEWLLKEIHHRVKNNLQIIISLLDSQSMYLKDNSALNAIRDSQSRVYCMSLIHKKLYQSDNIAVINMKLYIEELVDYLSNAFGARHIIGFELDIAEVHLSASQSIPIGLILNEAITNSIKYAFPKGSPDNTISVQLSIVDSQCRLEIRDNGIGLPAGFSEENIKSLGLSLMKGLSEDIDATFSIENREGTCVEIIFMPEQLVPSLTTSDESITLITVS